MIALSSRRAFIQNSKAVSSRISITQIFSSAEDDASSSSTSTTKTNQYLAQQRNAVEAGKRKSRKEALEQDKQRNLRLKRLFSTDASSKEFAADGYPIPSMYQIRIAVDKELREELKMNGREKRGRVFIEKNTEGCSSLRGLKSEMHAFFRALKKSTYLLSANLPIIMEDGTIFSPGDEKQQVEGVDPYEDFWEIENDADVEKTFQEADDFYQSYNDGLDRDGNGKGTGTSGVDDGRRLKRPSILIHVRKDPNAPLPPPPPVYLLNMANPKETETMTMLSFYSFPPGGVKDPEKFAILLRKVWKPFDALGRVYAAEEGINAQMSIPTNVLANFRQCCLEIPELGTYMENDINIDPIPLTIDEFAIAGDMDGKPSPPFHNLHVRVRAQIVADGLDRSLDWESAGYDMPPLEWHEKLKEAREARQSGDEDKMKDAPLIFDCRNDYETSVGVFEGAETLDTENFRDSWDVLKDKLKDKPKDTPIMTYCTGGIRCVKVGAYLTQEMGFTNVSRLAGGIIAYDRTLNNNAPEEEPMFKGTNYVFDGRVGRQITDDALGDCMTCGGKTNLLSNCMNTNCHKRMVQCDKCRDSYSGTCSEVCKNRVVNSESSFYERKVPKSEVKYDDLDEYALGHSTPPSDLYEEIKKNTAEYMGSGYHMISDTAQGRLLCNLASMSREGRVLEIGGFTGYATCCFLEGAANAADATDNIDGPGSREKGAFVMSLERDRRAIDIAASHLDVMTSAGLGQDGAEKAADIREGPGIPIIESESLFFEYKQAGCELMRVTDALAYVEAMASGIEAENTSPFDIVFIDADKTRFLQYVEACLSSDRVLKTGGVMIVDNVLWKGIVLDVNNGTVNISSDGLDAQEVKKSRRARKLANAVHDFNSAIVNDSRVEVVMLNMRDGLSIIRKK